MVKREDLLKIFFLYLCLLHVTPGHPCGRNPISRFQPLTKMLGRDINSLLNLLRTSNPTLYQQVQDEWRRYADCVGLVDTGYFKRAIAHSASQEASAMEGQVPGHPQDQLSGELQIQVPGRRLSDAVRLVARSHRAQRLRSLLRSLATAAAASVGEEGPDADGGALQGAGGF